MKRKTDKTKKERIKKEKKERIPKQKKLRAPKPKKVRVKKERKKRLSAFFKKHRLLLSFFALVALAAILMCAVGVLIVNVSIKASCKNDIYTEDRFDQTADFDCILVLGCGVKADGRPSDMLYDRIKTACLLYQAGVAPKILFSGDHGQVHYDEVGTMMRVAHEEFGIPLEDIFLDHAGFSTYETMARAKTVFGVETAVVVTQEYHLYRSLFLADAYGIEAIGVSASIRQYAGQTLRDIREIAARCKDLLSAIFKPDFIGGEPIDLTGDGRMTHD